MVLLSFLPFLQMFLPLRPELALVFVKLQTVTVAGPIVVVNAYSRREVVVLAVRVPEDSLVVSFLG